METNKQKINKYRIWSLSLTLFLAGASAGWLAAVYSSDFFGQIFSKPDFDLMISKQFGHAALTKTQESQLSKIHRDTWDKHRKIESDIHNAINFFDEQIITTRDKSKLETAFSGVIDAHLERERHHFKMMLSIQNVLSFDQLRLLKQKPGPGPRGMKQRRKGSDKGGPPGDFKPPPGPPPWERGPPPSNPPR